MANNSAKGVELMKQSKKFYISYLLSGNLDDIQEAVRCAQEVFDLTPPDVPSKPIVSYNLARPLFRRFLHTRQAEDITKAIEMFRYASQLSAAGNPLRAKCSPSLIISYFVRDGNLDAFLELNAPDVCGQPRPSLEIETLTHNLGAAEEVSSYFLSTLPKLLDQDLSLAIQLCRQALKFYSRPPSDSVKISMILFHLGIGLNRRFCQQRKLEDNKEAAECFCRALGLGLPIPMIGLSLTSASDAFVQRYEALGKQEDLDNWRDYFKQAMKMIAAMRTFDLQDAGVAVRSDNRARVTRRGLPKLHTSSRMANNNSAEEAELMQQSKNFYMSYLLTGNLDDIQRAVRCAQDVFDLTRPDDSVMPIMVPYNLARSLFRRFLRTRQDEDITKAIEMFRYAFQLLADDNPLSEKCSEYLVISYFVRDGNRDGSLELNAPDVGSSQSRPSSLKIETVAHNLDEGDEVFKYWHSTGRKLVSPQPLEDLHSAIQFSRQALKFFSRPPSDSVKMSIILFHLGNGLTRRYSKEREFEDMKEAAECFCRALGLGLPIPMIGPCLTSASDAYVQRFEALGKQEDLDNAVDHVKQAMRMFDAVDDAKRAMGFLASRDFSFVLCLDTLARVMRSRYMAKQEVNDLAGAIDALLRAVDIAERTGSGDLPRLLNNLAANLRLRDLRTGRTEDMRETIAMLQRAVELLPPNEPRVAIFLVNLSISEYAQGKKLLDGKYIKRAAEHLRQAWSIGGESLGLDPGLDLSIINGLAHLLLRDYSDEWSDVMKWSEEGITLARIGTSYTHHPLAGPSRIILCANLFSRWTVKQEIKDIDEAISIARSMIELAGPRKDESILARKILGDCLNHRYKSTGDDENREEAVAVLLEGFRMPGAPFYRLLAGHTAIDVLSEMADWDRAHKLSREIVDQLVILNGRSLDWRDKQLWMRLFSYKAATYASIALEAGSDVLDVIDLLETCRGAILGHVIDNRTDLDDLTKAAPEKAKRFRTLQNETNTVIDPSADMNTRLRQITRMDEAEREIRACLEEIRTLEGFHRFLLGPTERELESAAARGPILIVNVTSIRSDAIIIAKDDDGVLRSVLLPLPEMEYKKVAEYLEKDLTNFSDIEKLREKNKTFRELQTWLWNACVKLIFKKLTEMKLVRGTAKFHVWWIGIGVASSLPFHAAGIYTGNTVRETALSRAISSYTPTLKVLIHARRKLKNDRPEPDVQHLTSKLETVNIKPRLAIIIMPSTPGMADLDEVQREAKEVQSIVRDTYSTETISQPSAKDTMARMAECEVVHFACHGESILGDPSSSHLVLQARIPDSATPVIDELKVRDVAAADLNHGKLAFLSACSTAQNRLVTLSDEVLHLASGFQVAGYLHAIGNLWLADDKVSVQLVTEFYQHLVAAGELGDGHNVAQALNGALIVVAKKFARQPLSWAQFVHFGV